MICEIQTPSKKTILSVNSDAYNMLSSVNARYIMAPVYSIYRMYQQAVSEHYPIFDANIREYLGSTGAVNKKIRDTLKAPEDRKNFFHYNNGITVIVKSLRELSYMANFKRVELHNPQIVNGCQTVSTIHEVLSGWPEDTIQADFENTFVMMKILVIPDDSEEMAIFRNNIVTYNNSQNSIDQKTFEASSDEFKRLQIEFARSGLLVCIRQSDKYQYTKVKYKKADKLMNINSALMKKYGMSHLKTTKNFLVPLDKLLQVILAFTSTTQDAVGHKARLLVSGSEQNKKVIEFIRRDDVTISDLISLWMLYLRSEYEKKSGKDKIFIPLYMIHCLCRYECGGEPSRISAVLCGEAEINRIINLYKGTFKGYFKNWKDKHPGHSYNDMIKGRIDYEIMDMSRDMALSMMA